MFSGSCRGVFGELSGSFRGAVGEFSVRLSFLEMKGNHLQFTKARGPSEVPEPFAKCRKESIPLSQRRPSHRGMAIG